MRTWILTDGKIGDDVPCLGLAERLGLSAEMRRVRPRAPWVWAMPWGPIDPAEAPDRPDSPLAPPWPDLVIAAGRRSVPYLRQVRRHSPRTLTVFIRDPRTGAGTADIIWVPEHDRLRGPNVLVSPASPHRISPERLDFARNHPPPALAALPAPRVAVLLGGDSRHHRFTPADIDRLTHHLEALVRQGGRLMITASRRTPPALRARAFDMACSNGGYAWDGEGDNPYIPMLALADIIVVTADSTNMLGEAAATGTGIYVFEPSGGHPKINRMVAQLQQHGAIRELNGKLEPFSCSPLDSTPILADAVRTALRTRGIALPPNEGHP